MPTIETPRQSTEPDPADIRRAILEHRKLEFYYVGNLLTVEPYVLGLGKRYQSPVVLAWDETQGWREYSCVRIRRLRVLDDCYDRSQADYDPANPRLREVDTAAPLIGREVSIA